VEELFRLLGIPDAWIVALDLGLLGRLILAAVLGGVIGLERELSGKPAGLRTNLLICVGAALLTELSIGVAALANQENAAAGALFRADPARIAAQIVSGIGFLGAGTIIQARGNVVGLTTAATLWVVAAIGMAVGARAYVMAAGSTALVYGALVVLGRLEIIIVTRRQSRRYSIVVDPDPEAIEELERLLRNAGLDLEAASIEKGDRYEGIYDLTGSAATYETAIRSLTASDRVHRATRLL
jgi:putative Mg2+ transporter-C (MgtC) family protein